MNELADDISDLRKLINNPKRSSSIPPDAVINEDIIEESENSTSNGQSDLDHEDFIALKLDSDNTAKSSPDKLKRGN